LPMIVPVLHRSFRGKQVYVVSYIIHVDRVA
jgi:hypothetical protein